MTIQKYGGNGEGEDTPTPPGEYGGSTETQAEMGRLHMQLMRVERDVTARHAAELACSDHVARRLGAVELELARYGRHVSECAAQMSDCSNEVRQLRKDLNLFFEREPQ